MAGGSKESPRVLGIESGFATNRGTVVSLSRLMMIDLKESFLRGSYPPVITPFKNGAVDVDAFRQLVWRQVECGSHGVVVAGTTGEPSSLTVNERCELSEWRLMWLTQDSRGSRYRIAVAGRNLRDHKAGRGIRGRCCTGSDSVLYKTSATRPCSVLCIHRRTNSPAALIYHIPWAASSVTISPSTVAQIVEQAPTLIGT